MTVTLVIQAGGRSSRMGRDKGLVLLDGKPLVQHIVERTTGLADETLLITNHVANYAQFNLPMASDPAPGAGALPGLHTALAAATGTHVLLIACDMPFVSHKLLYYQLEQRHRANVIVPVWDGYHQTMHAVYEREPVLAAVATALTNNQKRMIAFYNAVSVLEIGATQIATYAPDGTTFFNINTPTDLANAEARLAARPE